MTDNSEIARVAALDSAGSFGSAPEERFDRITRVVQQVLGMPNARISLLNDSEQFFTSPQLPGADLLTNREGALRDATLKQSGVFVVPDASKDPRFAHQGTVAREIALRFYAGVPLALPREFASGVLCVYDSQPHAFDEVAQSQLEELATWAAREIFASANRVRSFAVPDATLIEPQLADGYGLAGLSLPHGDAAGDFYSITRSADTIHLTLADVMGKGGHAAMLATRLRSAFDAHGDLPVADAITAVNNETQSRFAEEGSFATVFHAQLDRVSGRLEFVDGGHGLTIIIGADGTTTRLHSTDIPLGIGSGVTWKAKQTTLGVGDILVCVSDGVLDLYNGTLTALDEIASVTRSSSTIREGLESVLQRATESGRDDDITAIVVVRRQ